ncbi:hypothetical protein Cadr_000020819 [Camelus dromedarius]|uniref:Uncharacterized protein n=1 Tax=Camelus dromedarius TaxID=9838 RepID=A0A5N4CTK4_CAMDR|nr:hypothetical protein Cadr_000020819 [Camelus dromedarius]
MLAMAVVRALEPTTAGPPVTRPSPVLDMKIFVDTLLTSACAAAAAEIQRAGPGHIEGGLQAGQQVCEASLYQYNPSPTMRVADIVVPRGSETGAIDLIDAECAQASWRSVPSIYGFKYNYQLVPRAPEEPEDTSPPGLEDLLGVRGPQCRIAARSAQVCRFHLQEIAEDELAGTDSAEDERDPGDA